MGVFTSLLLASACGEPFSGSSADTAGTAGRDDDAGNSSTGGSAGNGGSSSGGSSGGSPSAQAGDTSSAGAEASVGGASNGSSTCEEGTANCNGDDADGCETTLGTEEHCGGCQQACQDPQPYCAKVEGKLTCTNPAQALSGKRIELPCVAGDDPVAQLCPAIADRKNQCPVGGRLLKQTINLSGAPNTLYSVTLHIRGVVEPRTYVGGKDAGGHFYIGGVGQQPSNYNTYSIVVSSPAQTFYLNADTQPEGYRVFAFDTQKAIVVEGGARISLQALDPDCAMVRNCQSFVTAQCAPYVVADVPPAPKGYDGQFVQLDVVSVTPAN